MASRRTRIKGIANIPQRRKGASSDADKIIKGEKDEVTKHDVFSDIKGEEAIEELTKIRVKIEPKVEQASYKFDDDSRLESYLDNDNIIPLESTLVSIKKSDVKDDEKIYTGSTIQELQDEQLILNEIPEETVKKTEPFTDNSESDVEKTENVTEEPDPSKNNIEKVQAKFGRRKFLKPSISSVVLNRKPKENAEKNVVKDQEEKNVIVLDQVVIHPPASMFTNGLGSSWCSPSKSPTFTPTLSVTTSTGGAELTLDETSFSVPRETPSPIRNKVVADSVGHGSDSEYPPPPPSPSKINRSRIKAIPRLSQRKTSFSASESEDESRRHVRIRNDSVCSVASNIQDPPPSSLDSASLQKPQTPHSVPQKRISRTEQSRKIAEARREFQRKFGSKNPDKGKLRMIDLIFYNPRGSPMDKDKRDEAKEDEKTEEVVADEEEKVDEPAEEEKKEAGKVESDEENEMPVPQIKIGPSGEIVLDEQSLVVESQEVKKQKEQMQKSALVNGDFDSGYGLYKKVKRARDWSHRETLRFYKALNMIGTDFSLMVDLFPSRDRRELKMKFKKEERVNRSLIDRAVMRPCQYNYAELKREVEQEEREFEELRRIKEDSARMLKERREVDGARKRKAKEEREIKQEEEVPKPPKIPRRPKTRPLSINSILDDSDADVSDIETQSDSEDDVMICLKPTRSGRIPKATQRYDEVRDETVPINLISCAPETARSVINMMHKYGPTTKPSGGRPKKIRSNVSPIDSTLRRASVASNPEQASNLEPGSVVILSEENETGEQVYKMYMVTPEKKMTPVDVDPATLSQAVRSKLEGSGGLMGYTNLIVDENVTISEDETETLRTNHRTIKNEEQQNEVVALNHDKDVSDL